MIERSVNHSTIVIERTYDASPSRVFAAWSDPEALLRWGSPGEGWEFRPSTASTSGSAAAK